MLRFTPPILTGLFFTLRLWASQPHSHAISGCSAAIQREHVEIQNTNKKNLDSFYEALANAPDNQPQSFVFSRNTQVICPFKNLCGVGASSLKMELHEWLHIMSQNQVGRQL